MHSIPSDFSITTRHKTRVLFLGLETYGRVGGIQRFNQRLVKALLSNVGTDRLTAYFTADKNTDIPIELRRVAQGFNGRKLSYLIRSFERAMHSDILILGHINLLLFGVLIKKLRPKTHLVLMAHGVEVWNDPAFRKTRAYESKLLKVVDTIATVSAYTKSIMLREFNLSKDQFMLFPNTVDPIIDDLHTPATPAFALAVSRMDKHDRTKHLDQIIRAMALLPETLSHTRLVIVGDGVFRKDLETLAQHEGVADRITFAGQVSNERLLALYQTATQFVLPSSKEGFGIVYLEAWAHLLPVICSIHGAAPEVVSDGIDGFAVEPMDTRTLAERMARLFMDVDLCNVMGRNGAKKLLSRYTTQELERNVEMLVANIKLSEGHG